MKICVLIRVFDRIEDLENNLKIIKNTWNSNEYDIVVSFNGKSQGYELTQNIINVADRVVSLDNNVGHLKGNSQLLLEGIRTVNIENYDFVLILEADTWLYSDEIINKYCSLLQKSSKSVWASARWYDRFLSLATDFALIKTSFLKDNIDVFDFKTYPECYVCNYILDRGYSYIEIKENMNVQIPSYFKTFPFAPEGRFYSFPKSKMVTHHIEDLKGGIDYKKMQFNIVSKTNYFTDQSVSVLWLHRLLMFISHFMDKCLLRRSMYSSREKFDFEKILIMKNSNLERNIIVNAYPLRFSGALQILRQFIQGIEQYSKPIDKYYIFIDSGLDLMTTAGNIEFIKVKQNAIAKKLFIFNFFGLKKYLAKKNIKADKIISLANINTSLGKGIEEYVYFHQPLTVYRYKWSLLNKTERSLYIYKHYYKWIIQRSLTKKTIVIAQLDCIKRRFSQIFGVNENQILKISPNVIIPKTEYIPLPVKLDDSAINLIYPATPIKYKNHSVIIEALRIIPEDYGKKIKLYLTCNSSDIIVPNFNNLNLEVLFLGHISFDELMMLYRKIDALVFPSYIESFGLPMIEAATTGIKILAADTDFANEVLKDYAGVKFISSFDENKWMDEIIKIDKAQRFDQLEIKVENSWSILFDKINK